VGEGPSLKEIYDGHYRFVWRVARRLGVAEATLDDVVQEVFVVMHRRRGELDMTGSIPALLYGITRRVAGRTREVARQREARATQLRVVAAPVPAPTADPEARTLLEERAEVVRAALDAMDEDKRMMFVLTQVEGMSIPEAAAIVDVNVNTASARVRAARELVLKAIARHRAREERIRVHAAR
jgi:RNA polymerase sigma-70 factor (ECF subfamily)